MKIRDLVLVIILGVLVGTGYYIYTTFRATAARGRAVSRWMANPTEFASLRIRAGSRCGDAPFIFPTDGVAGFIWGDSFRPGHRHQGVDIFSGTAVGVTPVIAAYDGYLSRDLSWRSAVIMRVPRDPLNPNRQIWVYYTHMADAVGNSFISKDFPPGTREVFVKAGTQLGTVGDYSGDPANPVGVHLHISLVKDEGGRFMNETDINNTYDPSPYFGMALNAKKNRNSIPVCEADQEGARDG
jgi:murein DD-endopeptidase MepM/ murein hydrolase activator NlpD